MIPGSGLMGIMAKKIADDQGYAALCAYISAIAAGTLAGNSPHDANEPGTSGAVPRNTVAMAVRWTLQMLAERAPGHAVEVRVPPFGAVQVMAGTAHRRGTPPAVVEMSPSTWLALAVGRLCWADALGANQISASGERADLSELLPLNQDYGPISQLTQ
ncbi:hypothetical protein HHJ79_10210 [Mobiluncus mulieris]|nr:hypothetical protein [Mobiluncus mulieris]